MLSSPMLSKPTRFKLIAALLALLPMAAFAQNSPLGRWKTFDDATGKAMSVVEVYEAKGGTLAAKVVETLNEPNAKCNKCSGDKKGKPVIGMVILWDLKKTADGWGGGKGFKPSTGDSFNAKSVKLLDGGNKLEVTGCKLGFCKHPTWTRVQ